MRKIYSGYGVAKMLDTAFRHGLTKDNSILRIRDKTNLDSYWTITVKEN